MPTASAAPAAAGETAASTPFFSFSNPTFYLVLAALAFISFFIIRKVIILCHSTLGFKGAFKQSYQHFRQKRMGDILITIAPYLLLAIVYGVVKGLCSKESEGLALSISVPHLTLFGLSVSWSVVVSAGILILVVAFLLYFNLSYKKRMTQKPHGLQTLLELLVTTVDNMTTSRVGQIGRELSPYLCALGTYIALGCLVELFGVKPMTADLSTTGGLGLCTFFMINYFCIKHRGIKGRLSNFTHPMPLLAPFKLISDVATPISLACRLYGNILAGTIVMELLYFVIPVLIPGVLSLYFNLFHTAIQVYIFIYLSLSFIAETVEVEE